MEKLLVTMYIVVFLVFCAYIWNCLNSNNDLKQTPKLGSKEYYKQKYLYHRNMSDKHSKKAQRALRKYKKLTSKRGRWR